MECEYADPRYLVLMFTPENPVEDMARLEAALAELCARGIPPAEPPAEHREAFCTLARQAEPRLTVRQAVFAPQETIPAGSAAGQGLRSATVPARPPPHRGQRRGDRPGGAGAFRSLRRGDGLGGETGKILKKSGRICKILRL